MTRVYCDHPGLYAVTLVRGGVEVACRVDHAPTSDPETGERLDRSWWWTVEINGEIVHQGPTMYPKLLIGRAIDQAEYDWLLADRAWASRYAPGTPEANPRKPAKSAQVVKLF